MKKISYLFSPLVFSLLALLVSGCAATNIGKDYVLDEAGGKGVLLASMTQAGLDRNYNMFVALRGVDNEYSNSVPVTDLFAGMDWPCPFIGTSSEEKPCGRLAVIELPQGEYEFYSWHGGASTGPNSSVTVKAVKEFSKRFKVTAGQVVYVGNVHFSVNYQTFQLNVRNKKDRDLTLFATKYPNISPDNIQTRIIE